MLGVRFLDADFIRINLACGFRLFSLYTFIEQSIPMEKLPARPPEDRQHDRTKVRRMFAKGVGILKVAKSLGIGTGTVQHISGERAMSLRGAEQ